MEYYTTIKYWYTIQYDASLNNYSSWKETGKHTVRFNLYEVLKNKKAKLIDSGLNKVRICLGVGVKLEKEYKGTQRNIWSGIYIHYFDYGDFWGVFTYAKTYQIVLFTCIQFISYNCILKILLKIKILLYVEGTNKNGKLQKSEA